MQNNTFLRSFLPTSLCILLTISIASCDTQKQFIGSPLGTWSKGRGGSEIPRYLKDNGLNLLNLSARWDELEATVGRIDISNSPLNEPSQILSRYDNFTGVILCVKMIDTNVRTMPDYLSKKPFDDPDVIEGYLNIIDALAEHPLGKHITIFLVGNEVDLYFTKHRNELDSFISLYARAKERLNQRMPNVKVGTVNTYQGIKSDVPTFNKLKSIGDIIALTYYPFSDFAGVSMRPISEVDYDLRFLAEQSGNKPFGFVEIGYSAATTGKSSEAIQADFVRQMFKSLDPYWRNGNLMFLHYMTTYDLPPELVDHYTREQGVASRRFNELIMRLGLHVWETGRPREGWTVFVKGANAWRKGRPLPKEFDLHASEEETSRAPDA
jgi:hypothetical protein